MHYEPRLILDANFITVVLFLNFKYRVFNKLIIYLNNTFCYNAHEAAQDFHVVPLLLLAHINDRNFSYRCLLSFSFSFGSAII